MLTIMYSLGGIPLVLLLLQDFGKLLTVTLKYPWFQIKRLLRRVLRLFILQKFAIISILQNLQFCMKIEFGLRNVPKHSTSALCKFWSLRTQMNLERICSCMSPRFVQQTVQNKQLQIGCLKPVYEAVDGWDPSGGKCWARESLRLRCAYTRSRFADISLALDVCQCILLFGQEMVIPGRLLLFLHFTHVRLLDFCRLMLMSGKWRLE